MECHAVLAGSPPPQERETVAVSLEQLMNSLSSIPERRACFVEKRFSALLTTPMESHGMLAFTAPAYLEKQVLRPGKERFVAEGDRLRIEDHNKGLNRRLALSDYPALQTFVEAFRATLAGNKSILQRFYSIKLSGEHKQWHMTLSPLNEDMRQRVSLILIEGESGQINSIETREPDGDYSVMTINPASNCANPVRQNTRQE